MKIHSSLSRLCMVIAFIVSAYSAVSQVKPYNFPKIKPEDFKSKVYDKDTSAAAVVLGDLGETYYEYSDQNGFRLMFDRHLRIRILKKEGYEYATREIELYRFQNGKENLSDVKAYSYNLVDGKVVDEKLSGSSIFTEEVRRNKNIAKFTMPGVREGSIIDIRYRITSDFVWNIQDWFFQWEIPVQWSEYIVTVPEYYTFSKLIHGGVPFVISEMTVAPGSLKITGKERSEGNVTQTKFETYEVNFKQNVYHYAAKDVPSLKPEPYSPALTNFISKIEFELQYSNFPDQGFKNYTSTWEDICANLLFSEDFGSELSKSGIVKNEEKDIRIRCATENEKMIAAHDAIRGRMRWNGYNGIFPTTTLREAYEKRSGNDADINLLLVDLLKTLDLNAAPVVLSTRDNGILVEAHPVQSRLNYVLASVTIGDKTYLLDATCKNRPYHYIPSYCLNGKGLLVAKKDNIRWIPLLNEEKENTLVLAEMKIASTGEISGNLNLSASGYPADEIRQKYIREGQESYLKELKDKHNEWNIEDFSIINLDSLGNPLSQKLKLSSSDLILKNSDMIYFNCMVGFGENNNPFRDEKRENTIDFIYPIKKNFVINLEIPEGYTVESIPEPIKLLLPDQAGSFRYNISATGNRISINSTLNISKVMYTNEEYSTLREFFTQIVTKHAQQIVLKKI